MILIFDLDLALIPTIVLCNRAQIRQVLTKLACCQEQPMLLILLEPSSLSAAVGWLAVAVLVVPVDDIPSTDED